ncbi:pseudouridine synthase [Frigidibacter sp. MR17.24]|uniref:pseudouridine synthase n=1 Tax=Frigidibacter sp. MR17.24 TaxID=3127345 RepID=UPI003012F5D3
MTDSSSDERIAKVMARAGVASRRDAERMILAGRVSVNGKKIDSPALDVKPGDRILLDGRAIDEKQPTRLWLYYKPLGLVVSEKDEKGRQTIFDTMPEGMPRVMSVGRLDLNSEGLLLLTNDGELKRRLELPETGWLRKYRVRVNGQPNDVTLDPLRRGITIDGEDFQPMEVTLDRQQGSNAWLTVGIREGRNREIRRAMSAVKLIVNRLIRVSYGPFRLNEMKPGDIMEVKAKVMRDQLGALLPGNEDHVERPGRINREGQGPKTYDQRNRAEPAESYRNRERGGDDRGPRPPRGEGDRPYGKPAFGKPGFGKPGFDRGPRPEGDRGPRPPRAEGDRPYGKPAFGKPGFGKPGFDRGPRPEGDRGPRPPRAEGDRPFAKPAFGAPAFSRGPRPEADEGEAARKPRHKGLRPPRDESGEGRSERPRSEGFGKGPRSAGFKSHGGPAGKGRAEGFKSHGDAARGGPARGPRPEGPAGGKPYGKPAGDRGGFGKPRSEGFRAQGDGARKGPGQGPGQGSGRGPGKGPGAGSGAPGGKPRFGGGKPGGAPSDRGPRKPR